MTRRYKHVTSSVKVPLPHSGEPRPLPRAWPQLQAEDVPQVLLPVGLLVPEDAHANTLGGEPQHADGLVVGGLPQVDAVDLGGGERDTLSCMSPFLDSSLALEGQQFEIRRLDNLDIFTDVLTNVPYK